MEEIHKPVLLQEVLEILKPKRGESYLDLTAGYGGHASCILDLTRNYKEAVLNDRDESAERYLKLKYKDCEGLRIVRSDFYSLVLKEAECGKKFDIILADFGVSSPQIDRSERGFSFLRDGALDMRMDREQELTAETVVNKYSERKLGEIFERYGEVRPGEAKRMAREIVHHRPFRTTLELAEFIKSRTKFSKIHPATKYFQAIRIEVNDELGEIERTLPLIPKILKPGGRAGFISFHSLEDRLVKEWMKDETARGEESRIEVLTKKPIIAGKSELVTNPRSRSAKLRIAALKTAVAQSAYV